MHRNFQPTHRGQCAAASRLRHHALVGGADGRAQRYHARPGRARKSLPDYWPPLYAYVRRRGYLPEDAQDLTQAFFARLLERNAVASVAPGKGRFRSFLLTSLNHFLADEWDKARALKRGGGKVISFDWQSAETQLGEIPVEKFTPEKASNTAGP